MGITDLKSILTNRSGKATSNVSANNNQKMPEHINDFKNILEKRVDSEIAQDELKLSTHAKKRLEERNLGFDGNPGGGGSGGEGSSNQGGSGGEGGTGLRVTGASNTITLTNNGDVKGGNASFDHAIRYNVTVT